MTKTNFDKTTNAKEIMKVLDVSSHYNSLKMLNLNKTQPEIKAFDIKTGKWISWQKIQDKLSYKFQGKYFC